MFCSSASVHCSQNLKLVKLNTHCVGDCKLLCLDSLSVGSRPMVALSLAELPGKDGRIVLAMGGLDNKIHLYCGERTGKVNIALTALILDILCISLFFIFHLDY